MARSLSSSSALRAPSRRHPLRAHSDSYNPIYSASSSASSDAESIFSYASSASSATTSSFGSTPRRHFSRDGPRAPHSRPFHQPTQATSDAGSDCSPVCYPAPGNTQVVLPRTLPKPQVKPISPAALVAASSDLANVPLAYIIQSLKDIGPRMMAALARTTAPAPTCLPRELDVRVAPDPDHDAAQTDLDTFPTHLLAVYSRSDVKVATAQEGTAPRRKVTLFPTHAVVLAAHCAHLPPLPPGGKSEESVQEADVSAQAPLDDQRQCYPSQPSDPPVTEAQPTALTLPVVPLCIPAPDMFSVLQAYLYTKRADHLLGALVPSPVLPVSQPPPSPSPSPERNLTPSSHMDSTPSPQQSRPASPSPPSTSPLAQVPDASSLATHLATAHPAPTLVRAALRTHGLWANASALGVFDERLWLTVDFAWRVLLAALECVPIPPSASAPPAPTSEACEDEDESASGVEGRCEEKSCDDPDEGQVS